ncbi:MAG: hypothetical protein KC731_41725 [Myxococcales bacterium]|nr:hypothetical protein [Myxococcales bacterium]
MKHARGLDDAIVGRVCYVVALLATAIAVAAGPQIPRAATFVAIGGVLSNVFGMLLSHRAGRGLATVLGGVLLLVTLLGLGVAFLVAAPPLPPNG